MAEIFDSNKIKRAFKAYDVRGRVPEDLDEAMAFGIGQAYAKFLKPKKIAVGHDIRLSSEKISQELIFGLNQSGVDVVHLGVCGTEQVYFAAFHDGLDGGIMVTASHNPPNHNGMKMVRKDAKPISEDSGLKQIAEILLSRDFLLHEQKGKVTHKDVLQDYVEHVLKSVEINQLKPLKIVCNSGNGVAGRTLDALAEKLPFEIVRVFHDADGNFPNGVPNPLLPENRQSTAEVVLKEKADLGVAWDGDFDRCFFFDEKGEFIDGYYVVGLLASHFLQKSPGEKILHDPRLVWDSVEQIESAGGTPIQYRSGHAFMKKAMRDNNAIYGGETSAHHYFRDFGFCDSGMLPWLAIAEMMSVTGKKLSELVEDRMERFPISGEINTKLSEGHDPREKIEAIKNDYRNQAIAIEEMDGLSMIFDQWRFNVRMSNTEPLIRLNVEVKGDKDLLKNKTQELLNKIRA